MAHEAVPSRGLPRRGWRLATQIMTSALYLEVYPILITLLGTTHEAPSRSSLKLCVRACVCVCLEVRM